MDNLSTTLINFFETNLIALITLPMVISFYWLFKMLVAVQSEGASAIPRFILPIALGLLMPLVFVAYRAFY